MNELRAASLVLALLCSTVWASDSPTPSMLGQELTPLGAVRTGNESGSIPTYQGAKAYPKRSINMSPTAVNRIWTNAPTQMDRLLLPDPGKPLFRITQDNFSRYAQHLSEGQIAMLKKYSDYFLNVYPTRRIAFVPKEIEQATIKNARTAKLIGSDQVQGARHGIPFPVPAKGSEVIWNHRLRFRGTTGKMHGTDLVVGDGGQFGAIKSIFEISFKYSNYLQAGGQAGGQASDDSNVNFLSHQLIVSPPTIAGLEIILHEHTDLEHRRAWIRYPGEDRYKRAPSVGYDTPVKMNRGMTYSDQQDMFNGPLDRYRWALLGSREMYMPYNSVRLNSPSTRYADLIKPGHIDQNLARYEYRRVWVVEARLREGISHPLKMRRFYVDEDTWTIIAADIYSASDDLWRYQEAHLVTHPYLSSSYISSIYYDLQGEKYLVQGVYSEEPSFDFDTRFSDQHFDPENSRLARSSTKKKWWQRLLGS